jgi:hypothetical protein
MLYEIVNMSDPYTIEAASLDVAAVACAILGSGQYQFKPLEDGGEEVPFFMFGGQDEWCQKHFQESFEQLVLRVRTEKREELADCLDSVLIGKKDARADFLSGRDPNETREAFEKARLERHDERLTSFNDIGGRAYKVAKNFRKDVAEFPKAPKQVFAR